MLISLPMVKNYSKYNFLPSAAIRDFKEKWDLGKKI